MKTSMSRALGIGCCAVLMALGVPAGASNKDAPILKKSDNSQFTPRTPPEVSYKDKQLTASAFADRDGRAYLRIQRTGKPELTVELEEKAYLEQLTEINRVDEKRVLVTGLHAPYRSTVALIDSESGAVLDRFAAWHPSISPNGRYVAFSRMFPLHGPDRVEHCYAIYDGKKTLLENRPLARESNETTDEGAIKDIMGTYVGRKVYPLGDGESPNACRNMRKLDNSGGTHESHAFSPPFVWAADSSTFVFLDQHLGKLTVVRVQLTPDGNFSTTKFEIGEAEKICADSYCYSSMFKDRISFGNGMISVGVVDQNQKYKRYDLPLSGFTRVDWAQK